MQKKSDALQVAKYHIAVNVNAAAEAETSLLSYTREKQKTILNVQICNLIQPFKYILHGVWVCPLLLDTQFLTILKPQL